MMILKAKALVVGLMMAGGVAAPVATFYATTPPDPVIPAKADLAPEIALPTVTDDTPTVSPEIVMEELAVKSAPRAKAMKAAILPPAEPEKVCEKRQLQTVGSGAVVICDIKRSSSGKVSGGIFAPIEKPATLAPRDLPSPSGLIR